MESYSRGRRGVPAKDVGVQKAREGSNPSLSANATICGIFYFLNTTVYCVKISSKLELSSV